MKHYQKYSTVALVKKENFNIEKRKIMNFEKSISLINTGILRSASKILKKQSRAKRIYIEKHVKLKNSKGPDASTSIDTEQLRIMVDGIRIIEKSDI